MISRPARQRPSAAPRAIRSEPGPKRFWRSAEAILRAGRCPQRGGLGARSGAAGGADMRKALDAARPLRTGRLTQAQGRPARAPAQRPRQNVEKIPVARPPRRQKSAAGLDGRARLRPRERGRSGSTGGRVWNARWEGCGEGSDTGVTLDAWRRLTRAIESGRPEQVGRGWVPARGRRPHKQKRRASLRMETR